MVTFMRLSALSFILLSALIFASCGKEASFEQPVVNQPVTDTSVVVSDTTVLADNGGLLKRMITQYEGESDSMIYSFRYDNKSKLIEYYGVNSGKPADDNMYSALLQFHRNDKGLVDEIKLQTYFYDVSGNPAIHWNADYKIYFDATKSKYKYALVTGDGENQPITDSIVYSYGGDNRLSPISVYYLKEDDTAHFRHSYEYIYNSQGNITKRVLTSVRDYPNTEELENSEFAYDDKLNPLNVGEEMLLTSEIIFPAFPTTNNITTFSNNAYPENNFTVQYTYNSHNKPTAAIWTYLDGTKMTIKYYYAR